MCNAHRDLKDGLIVLGQQGLTIYKALKQSNTTVGNWVAISGAGGGLGHLGILIWTRVTPRHSFALL